MKTISLLAAAPLLLAGCAYQAQLMPRDSGQVYSGTVQSTGTNTGTMQISIDGKTCSGPVVRAASSESFGFVQIYGKRGLSTIATTQSTGGSSTYKALLSCSDNSGLRCDIEGRTTGAGICVDSNNRVFDMIYSPS